MATPAWASHLLQTLAIEGLEMLIRGLLDLPELSHVLSVDGLGEANALLNLDRHTATVAVEHVCVAGLGVRSASLELRAQSIQNVADTRDAQFTRGGCIGRVRADVCLHACARAKGGRVPQGAAPS